VPAFLLSGIGFDPASTSDDVLHFLDACQGFWVKLERGVE